MPDRPGRSTVRYELDEHNRLVVHELAADRLVPARTVVGRISAGRGNTFVYEARGQRGRKPYRVELDGAWKLLKDHSLAFAVHQAADVAGSTLFLRGTLARPDAHALTVALRRAESRGQAANRLSLTGWWQADAANRLSFLVDRAGQDPDRLTLQGGWEVGPRHELVYRFRDRADRRREHELIFGGVWDIPGPNRLAYRLSGADTAAFEFAASLASRTVRAQEGKIAFDVGIGVVRTRSRLRRVTLFGDWRLQRDLSIAFEIPYAEGRVQGIRFEAVFSAGRGTQVAASLRTGLGEKLGLTLTLSRQLFRDTSLFLRVRKDAREQAVIGGVQTRF
jgi:hypothetical protein